MEEIVALPRRKPPFILWWTAAGFTASTFFGIGLVRSFAETGDENLTPGVIAAITISMVAVWILIPAICVVYANRHWRGLSFDPESREFILRRLRGKAELRIPANSVSNSRQDFDEFDARNALTGSEVGQSDLPGHRAGVTNRELHHDLLIEADGKTHAIECHNRAAAEAAAKRVMELVNSEQR